MSKPSSAFAPLRAHKVVEVGDLKPRKKRRRKKAEGPEATRQKAFVTWAREKGLEINHQNNGASSLPARIRLYSLGCTAGAADVLVFDRLPLAPAVRGLALEFKSATGEHKAKQIAWQQRIERLGWVYHLVRSAEEAIEVCQSYGLGLTDT